MLALTAELGLSADQKQRTEALFKRMEAKAVSLGKPLVEAERTLDQLFAQKRITPQLLNTSLTRIADLQSQLRGAHLEAHLAQIEILTESQVAHYMTLRGYTDAPGSEGHSGHHHG